ncbi:NADPH-dependent FMN reductase [Anaerolineae bacterium CFX9]|nr:NADPH-dependent FMN reductase [Anaerolineae bacterium CFX9]
MSSILLVAGSPSAPSRTAALLDYASRYLDQRSFVTETLHVRDLDATELIYGKFDGASIVPAVQQVASAAGIVVATPVYKAAYTGVLKTFLDLLPHHALAGKVVLPIALGGSYAHSLVIDYALRPVLAALGAAHVTDGLYLLDKQIEHEMGRFLGFAGADIENQVHVGLDQFIEAIQRQHSEWKGV